MEATGKYYVIGDLVQFTGLTDRTIRSYLSSGILQGEKINGLWHFTPEQIGAFFHHPAVRPSILAKNNGLVYDFLGDTKKKSEEICVIWDLPAADKKAVAEKFCDRICTGSYDNIRFSFDGVDRVSRVILKGDAEQVIRLMEEYRNL